MGATNPQKAGAPFTRNGKDYALLVATDDYDNWSHLNNPRDDARAVAYELKNYYGFETEVIENPTKEAILTTLLRYKRERKYSNEDQLFIFFAGHGTFIDEFKEGYIIAKDSKANDELGETYIAHSQLRRLIDFIPCRHIFVVLDVCFSGTIDEFIARRRGPDEYGDTSNYEFIERKLQFQTRQFLTSGGKEYVPDGRPGQHSPFVRKILEALRSYGGQYGVLTIGGVTSYVERVTPEPRRGEWGTNEPGSDFVFVARSKDKSP
ncbi:MAG: peptidase caspase catalytic subunit p20 [Acidobacteria bacterium]|nr:peptidase caspase catalytic subunit p20 [Acidobacteriota bacterium]